MHENNKKFFNKLYDDMIINNVIKEVNRPLDRDTKIKFVYDFLDRISRIENDVGDYRNSLRILKEFYYKKYVINEEDIPLNYYKLQLKLDCDKGLGLLELNDYKKHEMARGVILNQKKSLDIWLDYFLSDDGKYYPYELKYFVHLFPFTSFSSHFIIVLTLSSISFTNLKSILITLIKILHFTHFFVCKLILITNNPNAS